MQSDLTAIRFALIAVFADLMAYEGASRCPANGAHWPAEHGVTGHAADDSAYAGANLCTRGVGSAATQGKGCSAGECEKEVTVVHGRSPW